MSETTKYFGNWSNWEEMARELVGTIFDETTKEYSLLPLGDFPTDAQVIVAGYEQESYEGSSTVIFTRDGKLYEDSSSHCSCNGLEWGGGAEISWEYLEKRIAEGHFYGLAGEALEVLRKRAAEELTGEAILKDFHGTSV